MLCEEWQDRLSFSIDLNSATLWQLESCGLFTPYQAHLIFDYREKFGELLSIYELAALPGFRRAHMEGLAIHMKVTTSSTQNRPKPGRGTLILYSGINSTYAQSRELYPGSPWKTSLRFKKGLGKSLNMGLAFEKDQGEKMLYQNRPEHFSAFLEWKGPRIVEQLVIGSFRIHNGSGLILGSGLMHTLENTGNRPLLLSRLKPYAGASEALMHQGASCKINLGWLKLSSWLSFQNIDLSLGKFTVADASTDWPDFIRSGGYHRTSNEEAGRNLAYLGNAGLQIMARMGRLNLGFQYNLELNGLTRRGKDSLRYANKPTIFHTGSVHWLWSLKKVGLYGELVPGNRTSISFLIGSRIFFNDFLSGCLQLHSYGVQHRETFASAYSSGSHISNEMGLSLYVFAEPFRKIRSDVMVELFRFPGPLYTVPVPSSGFRARISLQNGSHEVLQWRIRLVSSYRQKTGSSVDQAGIPILSMQRSNRVDGRLIYTPCPWFSWQSRLVISYSPDKFSERGHIALQQLTLRHKKTLKCTARLVIYHIPSWERRIYLYEPGLYQQFSFPVYNGTGNKFSLLCSLKMGQRTSIELKGSLLNKDDLMGWETAAQLRIRL